MLIALFKLDIQQNNPNGVFKPQKSGTPSVLAAVALHPNEAPVVADLDADLKIIEELAQHPRVRAIGETGLDYFRTPPELRKRQQDSFKWHIELAKKTNKALVIHDRDSHDDVLSVLLEVECPRKDCLSLLFRRCSDG
jgi:TatD DNase family protein